MRYLLTVIVSFAIIYMYITWPQWEHTYEESKAINAQFEARAKELRMRSESSLEDAHIRFICQEEIKKTFNVEPVQGPNMGTIIIPYSGAYVTNISNNVMEEPVTYTVFPALKLGTNAEDGK